MSSGKREQPQQQQQYQGPSGGWQSFQPWDKAQPGYDAMARILSQQAGLGPQYVGPSAQTLESLKMAEGQLGALGKIGQVGQGNYEFLSKAADVANNPYVQAMLKTNTSSAMDALTRQMMPQLQAGAVGANQMGSSRLGLAQGQAIGDTQKGLQNANNSLMMGAYSQGLGAQQAALGSMGALQAALLNPALTMGMIGDKRESYEQAKLDAPWKWMQNMGASQQFLNPLGVMQSGAGAYPGAQQAWGGGSPWGGSPWGGSPWGSQQRYPGGAPIQPGPWNPWANGWSS